MRKIPFLIVVLLLLSLFSFKLDFVGYGAEGKPKVDAEKDLSDLNLCVFLKIDAKQCLEYNLPSDRYLIVKGKRYDYIACEELGLLTNPGEPSLPGKCWVIELPKGVTNVTVAALEGKYVEVNERVNLKHVPNPRMRIKDFSGARFAPSLKNKSLSNYNSSRFFPGKIISYQIGEDNFHTYLYVKYYPVQYIPKEKKAIIITQARIGIGYDEAASASPRTKALVGEAECLIISPPALYAEAKKLSDFHELNESIPTAIVNTTWIWINYPAASDPPYPGYKDNPPNKDKIKNYNYTLAKKIIAFISDTSAHPNLKYVVLFGKASDVPPSYFWYDENFYNYFGNAYGPYNYWVPTDIFYASPDYDLVPNYQVGRISLNASGSEYEFVVSKLKAWYDNCSYEWFKNVSLVAGNCFDGWEFWGELETSHYINLGCMNGMTIKKYYLTDNNNTPEKVRGVYANDSGFIWHDSHGSGDEMWDHTLDGGWMMQIGTKNLTQLPSNSKTPILLSPACMNGAFDPNLMVNDLYGYVQPYSFGMGILNSTAGGIAYIGGSRINFGGWGLHFENGTVVIDQIGYMDGMIGYVIKAYHEGSTTLGNLTTNALKNYLINEDMSFWVNSRTVFALTLLGDPALKIPKQEAGNFYNKPAVNITNPTKIWTDGEGNTIPIIGLNETKINCSTNSSKVKMKIINPSWSTQKTENITTNNVTHFSFIPNQQGGVCIRCIGDDEKETWVYAAPQKPGKVLVVDPLGKGDRYGRYYEHALNNNYYPYTYWDKYLLGVPDNPTSDEYPVAIFFTANACGYAVYPEERDWIKRYLDRGGKLLISGQDIGWDANAYGYLGWFNTYLHATYDYDWESNSENVVGVSGDAIGNGLSFTITNDLYPLLPDEVGAISPATPILNYTSNHGGSASIYTAGVKYAGSNKTVYLAFSFETISSESTRNELLERSLRWLVLPDFTLSSADISFEPEEPVENTTVKINITIHNSAAGNLSVPVQLWEGEPSIGKKMGEASASLLPWNSTNISFDWKATPKGLHDIYVTIDYDNVVKEGNETNNNASKTLNVLAGELFTHNFSVGWNLVCIPVTNNYRDAKALIENITWCEAVSKWNLSAQKFEVYKLGGENNFELEAAGGYFVYVTQNSTLNASGTQINITPSLVSKWQCFGVTNNSYPDAEALAQNITGCKAVAYWDNALGRFVVHIKGIGISNFSVKRGVAYLIWRD